MSAPNCPYCFQPALLVDGSVIYPHRADLSSKLFWACAPCGAWVGCHAGGDGTKPLGRLANAELRAAKQAAHAAFDPLWQSGTLKRRAAYAWLAKELGIPRGQCHIGGFDVDDCHAVVLVIRARGDT